MTYKDFELITWSKTFSCGIKLIDEQHKGLVDLVNDLFRHVTGDEVQEFNYFNSVVHKMVKYVKIHFATEEKIMAALKFPGYIEHKKAHEHFILTVIETVRDYKAGKRFTLTSISKFLKNWVLTHIAVMDKQYFVYLRKIARLKKSARPGIEPQAITRTNVNNVNSRFRANN